MIAARTAVRGFRLVILVGLALVVAAGCSESPSTKRQKALERGERYLADGKASMKERRNIVIEAVSLNQGA